MKQRVIFLFYHGLGHIIAFSKIARILENINYEVYFAGVGFFHQYITSQGFKSYPLSTSPFGLGLERWTSTIEKRKYIYWSALRDRINDRMYHDRDVELFWMLEELNPDIVLIDALQATDFIVLHRHLKNRNTKVAIIQTTLPMHLAPGLPPLNSDVSPDDHHAVKNARRSLRLRQLKKKLFSKLIHWGFDDGFLIKRRLKKNAVPRQYILDAPSLVNFSVRNIPEFIISPREFNYLTAAAAPTQHYIGFMTNEIRNEQLENGYEKTAPAIFQLKEDKNLKLIYCSFGTIEPKKKEIFFSLLKKIAQAVIDENYILIISLKANREDIGKIPTSDRIFVYNFVPQIAVLKKADLFITHGGLNSIKEAVHAEVPMLLYPVHPEYDPNGNTARIVYHGLGLSGKAPSETTENVKRKMKELLVNSAYKKKVQELKQIDLTYTPENFLKLFAAVQHLPV